MRRGANRAGEEGGGGGWRTDLGEGVHEAGAEGARRRPRVDHHGRLRFRLRRHSPARGRSASPIEWGLGTGRGGEGDFRVVVSSLPSRIDPLECPTGVCVNWDLGREEGEYRKAISRTVGGRGGEHHEYKICLLKKIMASLIWYSD